MRPAETDTLRVMQEPEIGALTTPERAFRFLWLRAHHPAILIQVQRVGADRRLRVKMLDKPWSATPAGVVVGRLVRSTEQPMSEADWERLADLRQADFWRQPSEEPSSTAVDGAEWIFEGVSWGQHHVVRRWSPRKGPLWELGRAMLAVAGIDVPADELY